MTRSNGIRTRFFEGVDAWAVMLYAAIVCVGFVLITSASWDESVTGGIFSMDHFYMKQLMWIGISAVVALIILLIDSSFYHKWSYLFYVFGIGALLVTLVFGREVNGAKAWFEVGSMRIQPVEFVKIATALALARAISSGNFSIERVGDLFKVGVVLFLPLFIIILQNDTGSGLVLASLLFVLYREGLNKWLFIPVLVIIVLFIFSFLFTPMTLLIMLILTLTLSEAMMNRMWKTRIAYLAGLILCTLTLYLALRIVVPGLLSLYGCLLLSTLASLIIVAVFAFRANLKNIYLIIGLFIVSMVLIPTTDYIFNSILKTHQQNRILSFLGIVSDPLGTDYNVNQAKIAIGSGGFLGKGFMQGTQIRYGFVPEKHTDFIFCTAGEEWGFVGSMVVLTLFFILIVRLMKMGERQGEPFGRIYCYSVAAFLLFHLFVNVGMTIGLMPVMGIPLPFVSYGGSSLVAFTIMLFIAIRLNASTRTHIFRQ